MGSIWLTNKKFSNNHYPNKHKTSNTNRSQPNSPNNQLSNTLTKLQFNMLHNSPPYNNQSNTQELLHNTQSKLNTSNHKSFKLQSNNQSFKPYHNNSFKLQSYNNYNNLLSKSKLQLLLQL